MSKGTRYLYFKSKEDLLFAICRKGLDMLGVLMVSRQSNRICGGFGVRSRDVTDMHFELITKYTVAEGDGSSNFRWGTC